MFEQRTCESLCCGASQHPSPTVPPSVRYRLLHDLWRPCFGRRQRTTELCRLRRPTSADFCSKDDQLGPRTLANELGIDGLLPCSRIIQSCTWCRGCTGSVECRRRAERTPMWCRWPTELLGRGSSHPQQLRGVVRLWCSLPVPSPTLALACWSSPSHLLLDIPVPRLSPERSPAGPELPLVRTLRDGGHNSRDDGHIGNDAR